MYTTMNMLRRNQACTDGYGKMASFFGVRPAFRDTKIPLHAVALVAGESDLKWVAENAMVIDPQEFEAMHRRVLPVIWNSVLYSCEFEYFHPPEEKASKRKSGLLPRRGGNPLDLPEVQLANRLITASTYEEMVQGLKEIEFVVHSSRGRNLSRLRGENLLSPTSFLGWILNHQAEKPVSLGEDRLYYIRHGQKVFPGVSPAERVAHALSTDPYDFVSGLSIHLPSTLKMTEKGEFLFTPSSKEERFALLRFLTLKSKRDYLAEAREDFSSSDVGEAALDALQAVEEETPQPTRRSRRRVSAPIVAGPNINGVPVEVRMPTAEPLNSEGVVPRVNGGSDAHNSV